MQLNATKLAVDSTPPKVTQGTLSASAEPEQDRLVTRPHHTLNAPAPAETRHPLKTPARPGGGVALASPRAFPSTVADVLKSGTLSGIGRCDPQAKLPPLLSFTALPPLEDVLAEMTGGEVLQNPNAIGEAVGRWSTALWSGMALGVYDQTVIAQRLFVDWNSLVFFPQVPSPDLTGYSEVFKLGQPAQGSNQDGLNAWLINHVRAVCAKDARCIVAVTGGPGTGKSSVADKLVRDLRQQGISSRAMGLDGYLYPMEKLFAERLGGLATFDTDKFQRDIQVCFNPSANATVSLGVFNHQEMRVSQSEAFCPADYKAIIVEGLFPLAFPAINERYTLKVGLFIDGRTMLSRMLARAPEQPEMQRVMYFHYLYAYYHGIVRPSLGAADLILDIPGGRVLARGNARS